MDKEKREFIKAKFVDDRYILSATTNSIMLHDIRKPNIILSQSVFDQAPIGIELNEDNEMNDIDYKIDENGLLKVVTCFDSGESMI